MDRFTALGFARCYGVYDDPPSIWRDPPTERAAYGDALWRRVDDEARRVAARGWGAP